MKKFVSACGLGASLLLSGCASIVSDSVYPVAITSSPDGSKFEIVNSNGMAIDSGTTPKTVSLKSGNGYFGSETYTIRFKKEGYEDQTVTLDTSMDGWYVGNIIFGGLIGLLIVDPISGAMWKLPESASVSLSESRFQTADPALDTQNQGSEEAVQRESVSPEAEVDDKLSLIEIDQIPEELRSELIRIN